MQFIIKTIITSLIIAAVSIISKKSSLMGAILISLPINSILAILWLYKDTQNVQKVIDFSYSIIWIIIPSLVFFIALVILLKNNVTFLWAILGSTIIMIITYNIYIIILKKLGINL